MDFKLLILLILILLIIIFIYIEPLFTKHKIKINDEYGSARFANKKEIIKHFRKEKIKNITKSGVPIFFSKNLKYVWFDNITPHYTYLGSTGSGKSVTAVIPLCSFIATAKHKRSVFITDPKGEIYENTSLMFKNSGYNVLTIDFREPNLSNKINILEPIIRQYEMYMKYEKLSLEANDEDKRIEYTNLSISNQADVNRMITSLSSMIMNSDSKTKDPFWENSAKNLLEGLIGFFLEEYKLGKIKRNQITMTSIKKFQNSSMGEINFKKFKSYIEKKEYGNKSKDSLTSILSSSENTYKSITAVFGEKMAIFDDINVGNITSSNDFDFDILGKEITVLYIIVPDEEKTYYNLVTIIVGLMYKELVKLANNSKNKRLEIEIDWILDEFANCPPLLDIEAMVSVSRSRGMRFHFFVQSFSQLDNVYGKDVSQIILDNTGLIYLKTNTQDTAEMISRRLGKTTIENNSISQSLSKFDYNSNKTTSLMSRELMTPEEIKQLHYKTIIFPILGYPIIRDTIIYTKFKCYKKGKVERKVNSLVDLKDTYFTVEQMKIKTLQEELLINKRSLETEFPEGVNEIIDIEKNKLRKAVVVIEEVLKEIKINIEYITNEDYRTFVIIKIDEIISQIDKSKIKSRINDNVYHLEIFNKEDKITIIEIHNKEAFINEELEKEVLDDNLI